MLASGFTNAPLSKLLVFYVVGASLLVSVADVKHYIPIKVDPHIWAYRQFWRILTWQTSYTNSTEVLFAVGTFYHMRIIERLWGTRKFATFLVLTAPYTTLLPPLILTFLLRPFSLNRVNYLPAGPTALLFALLAQYHATVPHVYKYRLLTAGGNNSGSTAGGSGSTSSSHPLSLTLTSKTLTYLLPLQLALSQLPGSALAAAVGWAVGQAYRNEMLPHVTSGWRVPAWLVGERDVPSTGGRRSTNTQGAATDTSANGSAVQEANFEGLRRRLEGEAAVSGQSQGQGLNDAAEEARRRTLGGALLESFRAGGA